MQPDHFAAIDPEMVEQLLPLGDSVIGAMVAVSTALITYVVGRSKSKAEIENLQAEKNSIEAASGVSAADAARVISEASAEMIKPLIERIKEQRLEITELYNDLSKARNRIVYLETELNIMEKRLRLQGETPPDLPTEVEK